MKAVGHTTAATNQAQTAAVIKIYPKGRFTQWLDKISVGDKVSFNGPLGQFKYHKGDYTHLGMVAGGTGKLTRRCHLSESDAEARQLFDHIAEGRPPFWVLRVLGTLHS